MGTFKITQNEALDRWVEAEEPMWLNADRTKLVAPDDPDAAYLFATPRKRIPREDAIRYGLIKADKQDKAVVAEEGADLVDGNVAEILADVGDNAEKARVALAAEQAQEKPRATLVAKLEKIQAG